MVEFGKRLLECRYEPWNAYYLDYEALKKLLKQKPQHNQEQPKEEKENSNVLRHNGSGGDPGSGGVVVVANKKHNAKVDEQLFVKKLDQEIQKITLFFLEEQGSIASSIASVLQEEKQVAQQQFKDYEIVGEDSKFVVVNNSNNNNGTSNQDDSAVSARFQACYQQYHSIAVDLLQFIHFVDLNVTGIRKILKKYDKISQGHLSVLYRDKANSDDDNNVKQLYHYEGIAALTVTLQTAVRSLRQEEYESKQRRQHEEQHKEQQQQQLQRLPPSSSFLQLPPPPPPPPPLPPPASAAPEHRDNISGDQQHHNRLRTMPANLVNKVSEITGLNVTLNRSPRALLRHTPEGGAFLQRPQGLSYTPQLLAGKRAMYDKQPISDWANQVDFALLHIDVARRRLLQTSTLQEMLAAQMAAERDGIMDVDNDEEGVVLLLEDFDESRRPSAFSNFLNLMSTFLYMTNYYIVAPTSGSYAQKLGGSEALAGIIIGMTPIAALVSTVLYSWWTSYSYKNALIFASTCSVLGNIFYAMALPCNSLEFALIGRLLNGFGSARSINRRYIADSFPNEERTAASAAFVTAGALGMAAGPAIASLLHIGNPDPNNPYWTVENAPGWFMFVIWTTYLVCLIRYFQEPTHRNNSKNDKQKQRGGKDEELMSLIDKNDGKKNGDYNNMTIHSDETPTTDDNFTFSDQQQEPPLWKNIAVMTTFTIYFVLKLVLESVLSSTATLTEFYFDWSSNLTGIYLAILGLLILPANILISWASRRYDDRELIFVIEIIMTMGCFGILNYSTYFWNIYSADNHHDNSDNTLLSTTTTSSSSTSEYTLRQYIIFSIILFVSTNSLEGPNMSLLSKTIPKSWSRGIVNVGLLATESGTLGRAVGDLVITGCGYHGIEYLLNYLFGIMSICSSITLFITWYFYEHLEEPLEKDD